MEKLYFTFSDSVSEAVNSAVWRPNLQKWQYKQVYLATKNDVIKRKKSVDSVRYY